MFLQNSKPVKKIAQIAGGALHVPPLLVNKIFYKLVQLSPMLLPSTGTKKKGDKKKEERMKASST